MDTDESVLPFSDLDKIGWKWGLFYIILFIVLIFVIPSLLVLKDIKSKGIPTKEITFNNIRESLQTKLINGNIIDEIRHFNSPSPDPGAADAGAGSQDPTIINPDEIPPKTCADINGNPDNSVIFNCEEVGGELKHNYESTICLNSGCTELDCCSYNSDTCRIGLYRGFDSLTGASPTLYHQDEQNMSDNIVLDFDFSELLPGLEEKIQTNDPLISRMGYAWNYFTELHNQQRPDTGGDIDVINNETTMIINCAEGRKNNEEYTAELREIYSGTNIIDDYERQAVVTCDNGYLNFRGIGDDSRNSSLACNDADEGYSVDPSGGDNARIIENTCICDVLDFQLLGTPATGAECPENNRLFCTSCNDGSQPRLIGEGESQTSTCMPEVEMQPCDMNQLTIRNGQFIPDSCTNYGETCELTCNENYDPVGQPQPVCQGGGNFSYTEFTCFPIQCFQPIETEEYQFDASRPCNNLLAGSESCPSIGTCKGDSTITPSFECRGMNEPITLSGCPSICDTSSVSHIERVAIGNNPNVQEYRDLTLSEMAFDSDNCGGPGNFISEGEQCQITCPAGKSLQSQTPTCTNGVLTTDRIQCM